MNAILQHFKSLPRRELQFELRRFTGDNELYLWEFVGLNWVYTAVRAGQQTSLHFGVPENSVIGYHVNEGEGHFAGSAVGDLENVAATSPPYPDPFK